MRQFVPERGKIMPRRISGITAKDQRRIAKAIKRAAFDGNAAVRSGLTGRILNIMANTTFYYAKRSIIWADAARS